MQALIYCGRYKDAEAGCTRLLPGPDRVYLQAETAWRSGDPEAARQLLCQALEASPACAKCSDLLARVEGLAATLASARGFLEEGEALRNDALARRG